MNDPIVAALTLAGLFLLALSGVVTGRVSRLLSAVVFGVALLWLLVSMAHA